MRNNKFIAICFIPLLVGILSVAMRSAIGPYWLGPNNDPAYCYLINFLYILDHIVPRFVEHPGTPLQVLGAVIIKIFNLRFQGEAMVEKVFRDPEFYMNAVHYVLLGSFILTLIALGYYTYKKTGNALFGVFLQLPALVYLTLRSYGSDKSILPVIVNIDAEPVLIAVNNLFLMCFVRMYFDSDKKRHSVTAGLFGLVCGLGVAMKITFMPMMLIPVTLLRTWRDRALFLLSSGAAFVFFTLPIISRYGRTWEWVTDLLTREDQGAGKLGLDPRIYFSEIRREFFENILLITLIIAIFLIYEGYKIWRYQRGLKNGNAKAGRALGIVLLTALSFFVIMARHPAPHYMVPAVGLIGLMVLLLYKFLEIQEELRRKIFITFVGSFILVRCLMAVAYQKDAYAYHHAIYEFSQKVYTKYKDCMVCPYYRSSSPAFALEFGDENAGRLAYTKVLRKVFPETYYFHYWSRMFHDGLKDISLSKLKQVNPCVLIYGLQYNHDFKEGFWIMEKLESGPGEAVYRVHTSIAEIAMQQYNLSREFLQRGEYKQAYAYALKAKAMGLPHIDTYLQELELILRKLK